MTQVSETVTYTIEGPNKDGGKVIKVGMKGDHQRYKCEKCGKKFRNPRIAKGKAVDEHL